MLSRIAYYIARALSGLLSGIEMIGKVGKWGWDVAWATARLPFELISTQRPTPHYEPNITTSAIDDVYKKARETAFAATPLQRDGYEAVVKYVRARRGDRSTIDLSGVRSEVRDTLFRMSEVQISRLSDASDAKIRRFAAGKDPEVLGVEAPTETPPQQVDPELALTQYDQLLARIRRKVREKEMGQRPSHMNSCVPTP